MEEQDDVSPWAIRGQTIGGMIFMVLLLVIASPFITYAVLRGRWQARNDKGR